MDVAAALVLVCDPDSGVRAALRLQLEPAGFRVLEAEDGYRAYAQSVGFVPDLVLTELTIDGIDGHALIRKLRAFPRTRKIPIVVLSSSTGDQLTALRGGATDFVAKPWHARELCSKLWELISHAQRQHPTEVPNYHSCFISYSEIDDRFVARLHRDLLLATIECWKWKEDARAGATLWDEIDSAMRDHGRVVLVASKASLVSSAVRREIERAIRIEDESHRDVLMPVTLDDFIFGGWQSGRRADVLAKVIADARGWEENPMKYDEVREGLIRDLRISQ